MAKVEKHPAPEKLLLQVTTEAVSALALAGEDKGGNAAFLEAGVDLIAKAWGLPQELTDNSHTLINRQKELVEKASGGAALPDSQILDTYDGPMIAELVWGLFETAIRLDALQDRQQFIRWRSCWRRPWTSMTGSSSADRMAGTNKLCGMGAVMWAAPIPR